MTEISNDHPVSWHPHGLAIQDYLHGREEDPKLIVHTADGEVTPFPISIYFRDYEDFSIVDEYAVALCDGRVLDIGAGAGAISLFLQDQGFEVIGIDIAEGAVEAMKTQGLKDARQLDIFDLKDEKFDTLLCLMNGIGFVSDFEGFGRFLDHARTLLNPGGQILMDSSDLREAEILEDLRSTQSDYFGKVWFQMEYNGVKGEPYHWLYLDQDKLQELCEAHGWFCQILLDAPEGMFLARLVMDAEDMDEEILD
jgi:SAM-dependent methyltransferase